MQPADLVFQVNLGSLIGHTRKYMALVYVVELQTSKSLLFHLLDLNISPVSKIRSSYPFNVEPRSREIFENLNGSASSLRK